MVFGAAVAVLGLGGSTFFQFEVQDTTIKTTNVGLAIMAIAGFVITLFIAKHPKDVQLFGSGKDAQTNLIKKIVDIGPIPWLLTGIVSTILSIVAFFIGR
jgi:hypothetical protein